MGNTALMYAAAGNFPHTCNELLNFNPNIFLVNENDETAYSLAVKNNANLSQAVLENYIVSLLTSWCMANGQCIVYWSCVCVRHTLKCEMGIRIDKEKYKIELLYTHSSLMTVLFGDFIW